MGLFDIFNKKDKAVESNIEYIVPKSLSEYIQTNIFISRFVSQKMK